MARAGRRVGTSELTTTSRLTPVSRIAFTTLRVPTEYVSTGWRVNGTPSVDSTASAPATIPARPSLRTSAPAIVSRGSVMGKSLGRRVTATAE